MFSLLFVMLFVSLSSLKQLRIQIQETAFTFSAENHVFLPHHNCTKLCDLSHKIKIKRIKVLKERVKYLYFGSLSCQEGKPWWGIGDWFYPVMSCGNSIVVIIPARGNMYEHDYASSQCSYLLFKKIDQSSCFFKPLELLASVLIVWQSKIHFQWSTDDLTGLPACIENVYFQV